MAADGGHAKHCDLHRPTGRTIRVKGLHDTAMPQRRLWLETDTVFAVEDNLVVGLKTSGGRTRP